jgi:nucleotide-binding universal stress UspA family protein
MRIRDVLAPVFGADEDEAAFAAVERLSVFSDAHIAALLLAPLPEPVLSSHGLGVGMVMSELIEDVRRKAEEARMRIERRFTDRRAEVRVLEAWAHLAAESASVHARHADISVFGLAGVEGAGARREVLEALLMDSGRPVLALPPTWRPSERFRRVMVAWDASREAARATADAGPFLESADEVFVVTVDARTSERGLGEAPGADIAAHLARRGHSVEVRNVDGLGADRGEALLSAALGAEAELIVMGGYGHARLQEAIFGGVTRTLIEGSDIPLLLSH